MTHESKKVREPYPAVVAKHSARSFEQGSTEAETALPITFADIYGDGVFQRMVLFFSVLSLVVLQCHSLSFTIIAGGLDHWCKPSLEFSNLSVAAWKNVGIPVEADGSFSHCTMYDRPEYQDRKAIPCKDWDYDENKRQTTIVSHWNIVCHRQWLRPLANAVYMAGATLAVPIIGHIADKIGRRPVIGAGGVILAFAGFGACFAQSFFLFLAMRFVVSGCVSIIFIVTFILLFEISTPSCRTLYCTIASSVGVVLGSIFFSVLQRFQLPWFTVQLTLMAPTLLLVMSFFTLEESPRWLMVTWKMRTAEAVVLRAAKANGFPQETAHNLFEKMKEEMTKNEQMYAARSTPFALFRSRTLQYQTFALFECSFAIMFAFYALRLSTVLRTEEWVKLSYLLISGPAYAFAYFSMNSYGRQRLLSVILCLLGGVSCLLSLSYDADPPGLGSFLLLLAKTLASLAVTVNYIYQAELFPTVARSIGICCGYSCGRLGAVFASLITGLSQFGRDDAVLALVGLLMFASMVIIWPLTETLSFKTLNTVREAEESVKRQMQHSLDPPKKSKVDKGSKSSKRIHDSRGRKLSKTSSQYWDSMDQNKRGQGTSSTLASTILQVS